MEWTGGLRPSMKAVSSPHGLVIFSSSAIGFALVIALAARVSLAIPGTPVPATLQTLAVLLAGALLGPRGGVASVGAYLMAGLAGAPVFAAGGGAVYLLGPTGGYLLGFLPAAWLAGHIAGRTSKFRVLFPGLLLATFAIHLSGWAQLTALSGAGPALSLGVVPFFAFDALKALVAAVVVRRFGKGVPTGRDLFDGTNR